MLSVRNKKTFTNPNKLKIPSIISASNATLIPTTSSYHSQSLIGEKRKHIVFEEDTPPVEELVEEKPQRKSTKNNNPKGEKESALTKSESKNKKQKSSR